MLKVLCYLLACAFMANAKSPMHHLAGNVSIDCLSFQTLDLFGDGWTDREGNSAMLYLFKPGSTLGETYGADCSTTKTTTYDVCPESDGHYVFTLVGSPSNHWEIAWSVTIERTGATYSGGYNTTLSFLYEESSSWSLVHQINMKNNSLTCSECQQFVYFDDDYIPPSSGDDKPKPKPKPIPGNAPLKPPPAPKKRFFDDDNVDGGHMNSPHSQSGGFKVTLLSAQGNPMFKSNGEGTNYFISDTSRETLIAQGTVCSDFSMKECAVFLEDGAYYFRVAGNLDDDAGDFSWSFCNTSGVAGEELAFHVQNQVCYPDLLETVHTICTTTVTTTLTMGGAILLSNTTQTNLGAMDDVVIEDVLLSMLAPGSLLNVTADYVPMVTIKENLLASLVRSLKQSFSPPSRRLSASGELIVEFVLTVAADSYGKDGTDYTQLEDLRDEIALLINSSFVDAVNTTTSAFEAQVSVLLSSFGLSGNATAIAQLTDQVLTSLVIKYVNYNHEVVLSEVISLSPIQSMSVVEGVLGGLAVGVGLVVAVVAILAVMIKNKKNKVMPLEEEGV